MQGYMSVGLMKYRAVFYNNNVCLKPISSTKTSSGFVLNCILTLSYAEVVTYTKRLVLALRLNKKFWEEIITLTFLQMLQSTSWG